MKNTAWQKLAKEIAPSMDQPVLLRDRQDKKLHVVNRVQSKVEGASVDVPDTWTEVIGWHAGNQIVRIRPLPEC